MKLHWLLYHARVWYFGTEKRLVNSVSYATKYTNCSVFRITTVHTTRAYEMLGPSLLLHMCMYCPVQFVFTVFDNSQAQPLHSSGLQCGRWPHHISTRTPTVQSDFCCGFPLDTMPPPKAFFTRQRSLRFASFPIHYHPNIRRYTECNCNLHGLQWGQGGVEIWDREHVVGNVSFTQKFRLLGAPQGSYLWDRCRNRRRSGSYNHSSVCKLFRTGQGSSQNAPEYMSPQTLQWSWCPRFEEILWIN